MGNEEEDEEDEDEEEEEESPAEEAEEEEEEAARGEEADPALEMMAPLRAGSRLARVGWALAPENHCSAVRAATGAMASGNRSARSEKSRLVFLFCFPHQLILKQKKTKQKMKEEDDER